MSVLVQQASPCMYVYINERLVSDTGRSHERYSEQISAFHGVRFAQSIKGDLLGIAKTSWGNDLDRRKLLSLFATGGKCQ